MITTNIFWGLTVGIFSGILSGSPGVLFKKIKTWNWENTWIIYSFWALIFFPAILVTATIPELWGIVASTPLTTLFSVFFFGAGWGLSNIGFGIGLQKIGLALTSVIIIGIGNALGAILPLIIDHPESIPGPIGFIIINGIILSLLGIAMCSLATTKPERNLECFNRKAKFNKGILICVFSGIFSAMFNLALIFGKPLEQQAVLFGVAPQNSTNVTWLVALSGGFIVTAFYCLKLLCKNRSFIKFSLKTNGINLMYTFFMAFLWFAGVILYGVSVLFWGRFGPSIGWPVFQSVQIMTANILGLITGEWRGMGRRALFIRPAGIGILIVGIVVISSAGKPE